MKFILTLASRSLTLTSRASKFPELAPLSLIFSLSMTLLSFAGLQLRMPHVSTEYLTRFLCGLVNNTQPQAKLEILSILGFKECNYKAKHLGHPFCQPFSRKNSFINVSNKIADNLKDWNAKVISQASRTILIKVFAQAIPTYFMCVSLFPKSVCHNIDAKLRKYL